MFDFCRYISFKKHTLLQPINWLSIGNQAATQMNCEVNFAASLQVQELYYDKSQYTTVWLIYIDSVIKSFITHFQPTSFLFFSK